VWEHASTKKKRVPTHYFEKIGAKLYINVAMFVRILYICIRTIKIRRNILHTNARSNSTMSGAERDKDNRTKINRGQREGIF
jgi:hypothetical protein